MIRPISLIALLLVSGLGARDIFLAPNGNDKTGDGSLAKPYKTLLKASSKAMPGDQVLLRGGIYDTTTDVVKCQGKPEAPILVRPYGKELPVLDGSKSKRIAPTDNLVRISSSSHVIVEGLEIRNSSGRGISVYESTNCIIRNCNVHHINYRGMGGSGSDCVFENNEVSYACLVNFNGRMGSGGWPGAMATTKRADGSRSQRMSFRNNRIHHSWGEGLIAMHVDGAEVTGNAIYEVFSVLVYVTSATNVKVDGNYLFSLTDLYNRFNRPATGVNLAMESTDAAATDPLSGIHVSNNLILRCGKGINFWFDQSNANPNNTYRDIYLFHNTIAFNQSYALRLDPVPATFPQPTGCIAKNNILYRGEEGSDLSVGNPLAWSFGFNDWPQGIPAAAAGPGNLALDPQFIYPNPFGQPSDFKLGLGSPCGQAGEPTSSVMTDYFNVMRSAATPSMGFHELLTIN